MKARLKKIITKRGVAVALALSGLAGAYIYGTPINPSDVAALLAVIPEVIVAFL